MFTRNPHDGIRALVFLANEIAESSTIHITDPSQWQERRSDQYQLKWRFAEDALSSWQVAIDADLALQLRDALTTAQLALNEKGNGRKHIVTSAIEAIENVRAALMQSITKDEPELQHFLCEA
ncbi:MAG: hypothetical protein QOE96_813 [Blastocatellia bacterium]|nr:hypothetical protein [Blastocatellia bacterium]